MKANEHSFETGGYLFTLRWTPRGVSRIIWGKVSRVPRVPSSSPTFVATLEAKIRAYFERGEEIREARLDLSAVTPFARRVLPLLARIPRGSVVSYGALAAAAGSPRAARAVGAAMAHNPVPLALPCHRVVAVDRSLRGFSGHGGLRTKRRLLSLEGVRWDRGGTVHPACVFDRIQA